MKNRMRTFTKKRGKISYPNARCWLRRGLLFFLVMICSSYLFSQQNLLNLKFKNATLTSILQEVKAQTGMSLVYNNNDVDDKSGIDIEVEKGDISEVMTQVLSGSDLTFAVNDNHLILSRKSSKSTITTDDRITVKGIVFDDINERLVGVSVVEKGTTNGVITDLDGEFTLKVPANSTLVLSYIGFKKEEVKVDNKTSLKIYLQEDSHVLEDIVVVGYGTMQRRAITSSVSSLRANDLTEGIGGSSIAQALKGKVSGLTVSGSNSPNSGNDLQLRGVASITASSSPLIVIDGIPGGDIRAIAQDDIESIDVLKDASAGAIYGSNATGGVIMITTKQAKAGKIKMTYSTELSMESIRKRPKMLSSSEYINSVVGATDYGYDTDWYRELTNTNPFSQKHTFSVSGGSEDARIYSSFMYDDQKGIAIGDNRKDYAARINADFRLIEGLLEIKARAEYREAARDERASNSNFNMAMWLNPTDRVYDASSPSGYNVITHRDRDYNPLADVMQKTNYGKDKWTLADATVKLNILPELSLTTRIGYQGKQWQNYKFVSAYAKSSVENNRRGEAHHSFDKSDQIVFDLYGNYNKVFDDVHSFDFTGGYNFTETNRELFSMTNWDFPVESIGPWDMGSGSFVFEEGRQVEMKSDKKPLNRLIALFGRLHYTYDDTYMVTATYRREGSTFFGKNNRWGNFWGVSGGWRIMNEAFMKEIDWLSDLRVRAAYGVTGNNAALSGGNYTTRMYKSNQMWYTNDEYGASWDIAYGSYRNVNPDLKWEIKKEYNIGIDYELFNGRLYGKFDYFKRTADDLLLDVVAPQPPMLFPTITRNVGSLENKGWEFEVGGAIVKTRDFSYNSEIRLAHLTSKIKNLDHEATRIYGADFPAPGKPGNGGRLDEGSGAKIGQFYLYKYAGVDEDGRTVIFDNEGVKIYAQDADDSHKRHMGNAIPKLTISWDHSFRYKDWDLNVNLRSWLNFDVMNTVDMYYGINIPGSGQNLLKRAFGKHKQIKDAKTLNDYWLEDGSFLKIDAITLGYNFAIKKHFKYVEKARFYLTLRDVATFTNYSGIDPEVNTTGLFPGYEWINSDAIYPKTMRFTLGVQLTF